MSADRPYRASWPLLASLLWTVLAVLSPGFAPGDGAEAVSACARGCGCDADASANGSCCCGPAPAPSSSGPRAHETDGCREPGGDPLGPVARATFWLDRVVTPELPRPSGERVGSAPSAPRVHSEPPATPPPRG